MVKIDASYRNVKKVIILEVFTTIFRVVDIVDLRILTARSTFYQNLKELTDFNGFLTIYSAVDIVDISILTVFKRPLDRFPTNATLRASRIDFNHRIYRYYN